MREIVFVASILSILFLVHHTYILVRFWRTRNKGRQGMITDPQLNKGLIALEALWSAMLFSLAIYMFMGLQVAPEVKLSINKDTFDIVRTVLYVIAFVDLIVTRYIRKLILSGKGKFRQPIRVFQHPVLQKYSTAMIVSWGISECIGIYGLILFFLGRNTVDLYLLIFISAAALFMYRPSKNDAISLYQGNLGISTADGPGGLW